MKKITLNDVISAVNGSFRGDQALLTREITDVSIDSRTITENALFVAIKGEQKIYVQVCWEMASNEETAQREYAPLLKISDQYRKVVISLDEIRFPNNNGIEHLFPWELSAIL